VKFILLLSFISYCAQSYADTPLDEILTELSQSQTINEDTVYKLLYIYGALTGEDMTSNLSQVNGIQKNQYPNGQAFKGQGYSSNYFYYPNGTTVNAYQGISYLNGQAIKSYQGLVYPNGKPLKGWSGILDADGNKISKMPEFEWPPQKLETSTTTTSASRITEGSSKPETKSERLVWPSATSRSSSSWGGGSQWSGASTSMSASGTKEESSNTAINSNRLVWPSSTPRGSSSWGGSQGGTESSCLTSEAKTRLKELLIKAESGISVSLEEQQTAYREDSLKNKVFSLLTEAATDAFDTCDLSKDSLKNKVLSSFITLCRAQGIYEQEAREKFEQIWLGNDIRELVTRILQTFGAKK
jgi:hypothetical protein